ncbi:MAG: alpha/beta fold hydrolase [Promethearchaeota archaeon]
MPYASSIDNEKIYYEVLGDGDISLVFIGGLGVPTGRDFWTNQLEFASKYKLILIDLAGYGKLDNGRKIHTMQLYGQDVKAVVEELDLKDVILIGISMGGVVILEAEKLIPERTIGLIPIDSLLLDSPSFYTSHDEEQTEIFWKSYEEDLNNYENDILPFDKRVVKSGSRELYKWDFRDILPEIEKPIKCIIAERTLPTKQQQD